jgi:hypothetical protein
MSTWKTPGRLVWHTVLCSQCGRVITRARLPGLQRVTSYRICEQCTAGAPARGAARPRRSADAPAEEAASS